MSFAGIDVGTTGCKVLVFSQEGRILSHEYIEYPIQRTAPGHAQLDAASIWKGIAACIRKAAAQVPASDPPQVLAVTSMGEAMVPVDRNRNILGPSLLNVDTRGSEYLPELQESLPSADLFSLNGNTWGDQYGATKLMWLREHNPSLYIKTDYFLNWASFVSFMLGADPFVDYSLANRSLLFDITRETWSDQLVSLCGLDSRKLPPLAASGTLVGTVSSEAADLVGLPKGMPIVAGAHDQCASAVGCGVILPGEACYGLGTFPCIAPVYSNWGSPEQMMELGLNVEHHAVPGLFMSFIFHMGGEIIRWYRDLYAKQPLEDMLSDVGDEPSGLLLLPYLTPMGPPDFISDQTGVLAGLTVETSRAKILQGIIEANAMALQLVCERLPDVGIHIDSLRTSGGGSRSDAALQINSDILGKPLERPNVTESGALGAGLLGAAAVGLYQSLEEAVHEVIRIERTFDPDEKRHRLYQEYFCYFKEAKVLMGDFNRRFSSFVRKGPK